MLIKKNVLIMHPADKSACAFYRCHAVAMLLNSSAGGDIEVIVSRAEITDSTSSSTPPPWSSSV